MKRTRPDRNNLPGFFFAVGTTALKETPFIQVADSAIFLYSLHLDFYTTLFQ